MLPTIHTDLSEPAVTRINIPIQGAGGADVGARAVGGSEAAAKDPAAALHAEWILDDDIFS